MNQFDSLRYRGVFDYPHIQTRNLLPEAVESSGYYQSSSEVAVLNQPRIEGSSTYGVSAVVDNTNHDAKPVNPPFTSAHVLEFMGWTGRHAKYTGEPNPGRVLDQRAAWIQIWLEKGRHEAEREQQRKARQEASSVSAKKSAQRRARAA